MQFLLLAQLIIFLLGWPLEWSEIIIIFVPIFLPLLEIFGIDPLFFGILVALNLQTSVPDPADGDVGVLPEGHRAAGGHPDGDLQGRACRSSAMVIISMVLMYQFPQLVFHLPEKFYGP